MKKLMTTLFAAAAAFGLRAADPGAVSGTSFEGQPAGDYIITDGTGELFGLDEGQTYWKTNETATLTIMQGESADGLIPGTDSVEYRPDAFSGTQDRYLKIKTTLGNSVTRNVSTNGEGIAIKKDGEGAYDGFYFDSLVKFTAFDSNPEITLGNDGKLAIWLKEELNDNDVPKGTNLVITAGYLINEQPWVVPTNYVCQVSGVNFADGGWHRVTVKAINTIYKNDDIPGFVVFVDSHYARCNDNDKGISGTLTDTAKGWNDVHALFPSAVQVGAAKQKIASVSFDGQGEVDDLVFTTKAPSFAKDDEYFTITLDSNIASVTYETETSGEITITETTPITYEPGMKVSIVEVQGKTGYMLDEVTFDSGVETNWVGDVLWYEPTAAEQGISVGSKVSGAYIVGGDKYETLKDAFDDITTSGSYEVKMTGHSANSIELYADGAQVTLDLMGFSITGDVNNAAIWIGDGSLMITNSAAPVGGEVVPATGYAAVEVSYGNLEIGGGVFEGNILADAATDFKITGGAFLVSAQDQGNEQILDAAVKNALGREYGIVEDGDYYVVGAAGTTTYYVEFLDRGVRLADTNIEENTTLVQPADPAERTGYTFTGWFTDLTDPTSEWDFETDVVTEATTLYAGWELASYSISYLNEDGSAFNNWAEGYVVTNSYTVEDVIVLPTADNINFGEVVGVSFVAWTNETGTVAGWPAGGMTGPMTVYAKLNVVVPPTKHDAGATILCDDATEAEELAADITATPAAYVNVPAGVANGAAYCALFRGVADGSKVTIELTTDAKAAAQTAADAAAATIPLSSIASGALGALVVIDAVPGLYYSLSVGETCTGLVENTPRVLAQDTGDGANINDGKISLTVGKPDEDATAGFYKVNVNIEPAPQN